MFIGQLNSGLAGFLCSDTEIPASSIPQVLANNNIAEDANAYLIFNNIDKDAIFLKEKYKINKFYKQNIVKTVTQCRDVYTKTLNQGNSKWEKERKPRITASRCYIILF